MSLARTAGRQDGGWRAVAEEMLAGTRDALVRFPVPALALALLALHVNLAIADLHPFGDAEDDVGVGLAAAALAGLAATLAAEARRPGAAWRHGAAAALALVALALIVFERPAATLQWALVAALAGAVPLAPYLGRGRSIQFWFFALHLGFAAALAVLALGLFAGGLSAVFASLTYLFGLPVPDRLYAHLWAVSGLFAAPLFGLGQVPRDLAAEPPRLTGLAERGMRALGDFVAAPLLLVYAAVLHAYALKIGLTLELPKGQIGWLTLAYGFCLFGSLIVIHPFLDAARAPTRLVLRIWPALLPVPLVLLFVALYLRVDAYGWTPPRYLLGLFGLVTLAVLVGQALPRLRGDIRLMVALPVAALALASFGPQGAVATALRSQSERFLAIVEADAAPDEAAEQEALAALRFLGRYDAILRVAPPGFSGSTEEIGLYRAVATAWGLDPDRPRTLADGGFSLGYPATAALATEGYDRIVPAVALFAQAEEGLALTLDTGARLRIALEDGALVVRTGAGAPVRFAIAAATVEALHAAGGDTPQRLALAAGTRRLLILPTALYGQIRPQARLTAIHGALALRAADWPPEDGAAAQ